jgi:hypothetical protein
LVAASTSALRSKSSYLLPFSISSFTHSSTLLDPSSNPSTLLTHAAPFNKMKCTYGTLVLLALGLTSVVQAAPVDAREAAPAPAPAEYRDYGDYGKYGKYGTYPEGAAGAPVDAPAGGYGTYDDYGSYKREAEPEAVAEPEPEPAPGYGNYGKYGKYGNYGSYGKGNYGKYSTYGSYRRH